MRAGRSSWSQHFRLQMRSQKEHRAPNQSFTYLMTTQFPVPLSTDFNTTVRMDSLKKFFKLYFIDYAIRIVLTFPPLSLSSQHPSFPQATPHHCSCPWVIRISSLATPFLHCTLHPHGYSVTTYLYFLIPSPLHPLPHVPFPSGNHHNALRIHDSVSVLLVCLVCFLDTVVDSFVFLPFHCS